MKVLAIDQGTSSTKALVVAEGGEVLGEGNAPVHPQAGADGAVDQDPRELLDSIVEAGRAALEAAGAQVEAVGLANQGETVLR
jgi:glycerol kinase